MKAIILSAGIILLFCATYGQRLFYEQFNTETIPVGWTIDQHEVNWSCEKSIKAFGEPNELRLNSIPVFSGHSGIISPEIDLSGFAEITLRFNFYVDHIDTAYTFGIATRSNGGNWNTVWDVVDPTQPSWSSDEFVTISNGDVGATDFQFCFFFDGQSEDIFYLFIDDVELFHAYNKDIELTSLNMSKYCLEGDYRVKGRITNVGNIPVDAAIISYQIDGGTTHQVNLTKLNLWPEESTLFNSIDFVSLGSGERLIDVWISEVDFLGLDDNQFNDSLSQDISIANTSTQRLLLFEEFASSTSVPCSTFNATYLHPLLEANEGRFTLIKYPMNYPEPGDPYFNQNAGTRQNYYGISNLPHLTTEGTVSGAVSQNYINAAYSNPALIEIDAAYSLTGSLINVSADIIPFVNLEDATAYICITEKTTTGNVMTNGETEFYNIMMDILPSGNGQPVAGLPGNIIHISESKDLSTTFIEEFDDLEIVVFIQDNKTKRMLQSSIAQLLTGIDPGTLESEKCKVFPNPFDRNLNIEFTLEKNAVIEINALDLYGRKIKKLISQPLQQGYHRLEWDGTDCNFNKVKSGIYLIEFVKDGTRNYTKCMCL